MDSEHNISYIVLYWSPAICYRSACMVSTCSNIVYRSGLSWRPIGSVSAPLFNDLRWLKISSTHCFATDSGISLAQNSCSPGFEEQKIKHLSLCFVSDFYAYMQYANAIRGINIESGKRSRKPRLRKKRINVTYRPYVGCCYSRVTW